MFTIHSEYQPVDSQLQLVVLSVVLITETTLINISHFEMDPNILIVFARCPTVFEGWDKL